MSRILSAHSKHDRRNTTAWAPGKLPAQRGFFARDLCTLESSRFKLSVNLKPTSRRCARRFVREVRTHLLTVLHAYITNTAGKRVGAADRATFPPEAPCGYRSLLFRSARSSGTGATAQTQAVPSASSRPREAAITAAPLHYREEAVTLTLRPAIATPLPFPASHSATASPDAPSPIARARLAQSIAT